MKGVGQPDGYHLSPGMFTKEWKLLGGLGVTQAGQRGGGSLVQSCIFPTALRGETR